MLTVDCPPKMTMPSIQVRGFTLIELLVAIAIAGILLMVAYPSYQAQQVKAMRTEAKSLLLDLAAKQEAFYAENASYANAIQATDQLNASAQSEKQLYTASLSVLPQGCSADATPCRVYTLTATPLFNDTECKTLTYNHAMLKSSTGSAKTEVCWK